MVGAMDEAADGADNGDLAPGDRHHPGAPAGAGELLVALPEWGEVQHL